MADDHNRADRDLSERADLVRGLGLAAIAAASAAVTATLVIGIGGVWLDRSGPLASPAEASPVSRVMSVAEPDQSTTARLIPTAG